MDEPIRVFVCEDISPILRKYCRAITDTPELELVGFASSGAEAIAPIVDKRPDVVLMDIEMETPKAGIEATRKIIAQLPATRIIILTVHRDDELIFEAFSAGAIDYMFKNATHKELLARIRDAYRNASSFSPEIAEKMRKELVTLRRSRSDLLDVMTRLFRLSPMELEVVELYMHGLSRAEINELRSVNMSTTKSQIRSILTKMDYPSMKELTQDLSALKLDSFIRTVLSGNHED